MRSLHLPLATIVLSLAACASTETLVDGPARDDSDDSGRQNSDGGGRDPRDSGTDDNDATVDDAAGADAADATAGEDGVTTDVVDDSAVDTSPADAAAECGDGNIDDGEQCDNGTLNSDVFANACRTNCTTARCGDRVVDMGEQCDDGDDIDNNACGNACIEVAADLCRPCASDADCGRDADRCIDVAGGRACGIACATDADCPETYTCGTLGDGGKQCQPESGACEACFDPDADGYGVGADCPNEGDDCDPAVAAIHPGATEICDGLDNNCSGAADEGLASSTWYRDGDGDRVGNTDAPYTGCAAPSGYVAASGDCLDTDASVFPGAVEICDGRDNNCAGGVDDGITTVLYPDVDGDGFGNAAGPTSTGCPRAGYVTNNTDCDDSNASATTPSAETCDGRDNDCDGQVDDGASCPCDVRSSGAHGYMFCKRPRSWTDAASFCSGYGYRLATPDDATENEWIRANFNAIVSGGCTETCGDHITDSATGVPEDGWCDDEQYCQWGSDCYDCGRRSGPPGSAWIGLNDRGAEGVWVWHSGSAAAYRYWNSGEPNDSGGEDCAELRTGAGNWNDLDCADYLTFICESL